MGLNGVAYMRCRLTLNALFRGKEIFFPHLLLLTPPQTVIPFQPSHSFLPVYYRRLCVYVFRFKLELILRLYGTYLLLQLYEYKSHFRATKIININFIIK